MFYSYVIKSLKSGVLYKGSTENFERRLEEHNAGLSNYTSKHIPWELVLYETFKTRTEALNREKWYKTDQSQKLLKLSKKSHIFR